MSTAKFEKLIDLIINEDQERAEQLFHEIVVEKSREIYESLMEEDDLEESMDEDEKPIEEDMTSGLIDEIEAEESSDMTMEDNMEDEEVEGDFDVEGGDDMGDEDMEIDDLEDDDVDMGSGEPATKDDIMDLSDKLDQLMAAFEAELGDEEAGEEDFGGEEELGGEEEESGVMESVELKKVSPPKHGDDGAQKNSPVAANAGGKGPMGKVAQPVNFSGNGQGTPKGPAAPSSNAYHTKSEKGVKHAGEWQNAAGKEAKGVKSGSGVAAPKPETKQASGVNTKDVVPESRKIVKKMIK